MPSRGDDRETKELAERKLSEEMAEQQLSNIVVELEHVVEWQANATGDETSMGDHDDIPFDLCEELESLGEGEITQRRLIQQFKLELMKKRRCSNRVDCRRGANPWTSWMRRLRR
jgi:hypothetical protein